MPSRRVFHLRPVLAVVFAMACFALVPHTALALGSTPVTVVNPADIAKAEGIQHPFGVALSCTTAVGNCNGAVSVPINERWIVESVAFSCFGDLGAVVLMRLVATVNGVTLNNYLPTVTMQNVGVASGFGSLNQLVRIYADPNTQIHAIGSGSAGGIDCDFTLNGQSIDVP